VIGNAIKVMRIATGEEPEQIETDNGKTKRPRRLEIIHLGGCGKGLKLVLSAR
jgi:hypothetical protein